MKKAGWHKGRNIEKHELHLYYDDYPADAISFLQEFGNLSGKCRAVNYTDVVNDFSLEPEISQDMLSDQREYGYYQSILNRKLYPIGLYFPDGYYICCDSDCRVYTIGEYCIFWGNNLYEGVDRIILQEGWDNLQLEEETGKWWNMHTENVELPSLEK